MKKVLCVLLSLFAFSVFSSFSAVAQDAAEIYKSRCSSCHGAKAEKGSPALKDQSSEVLQKALNGYIDGTFGGSKKAVMAKIAAKMSAAEIVSVSDYIVTLK